MAERDFDVISFLEEHGVDYSEASSGRQVALESCPNCRKSKKFYISVETGQFTCHYCAAQDPKMKGGPISLVMMLAGLSFREALKLVEGREVDLPVQDDSISSLLKIDVDSFDFHKDSGNRLQTKIQPPNPIRIPRYMLPVSQEHFPDAWKYLRSRGIADDIIPKLDVVISALESPQQAARVVTKGMTEADERSVLSLIYHIFKQRIELTDENIEKELYKRRLPRELAKKLTDALVTLQYRGRIIFPVKIRGITFGWVGRDYTAQNGLKVRNSAGQFKFFCVWNFDQAQTSKEVVIAEGIVSAIKCGVHRSVATLGKIVTPQQLLTLRKMDAETAYICLDPDAQTEAVELKRNLMPFFKNVYNVSLPPVKLVKCPACGKKHEADTRSANMTINCSCGSQLSGADFMIALKKADYKDAGDYTPEQMDDFIRNAKDEDPDGFLLGDSAFND